MRMITIRIVECSIPNLPNRFQSCTILKFIKLILEELNMARPRKEMDLKAQVMKRYAELLKQRNEIDGELKGLQVYLKSVGAVRTQKRGRKKVESGAPRKSSATGSVLSLIGKSEKGISIDQIMKQTKLGRQTVNGVLNRMKKVGKIKSAGRGVYVKA